MGKSAACDRATAMLRHVAEQCNGRLPVGVQQIVCEATGLSKARVSVIARGLGFPRRRTGRPSFKDTRRLKKLGLVRGALPRFEEKKPRKQAPQGEQVITASEAAALDGSKVSEMVARLESAGVPSFADSKGVRLFDAAAVRDLIRRGGA